MITPSTVTPATTAATSTVTSSANSSKNTTIIAGWILGITSAVSSGLVAPIARGMILDGMPPSILLLMRLGLTTLLIGITLAIISPQKFKITRQGAWHLLIIGILSGLEIASFTWSLAYVDAATSSIIKSMQPLVVVVLLTFTGERMSLRHWARLLISLFGIYLLVGVGGNIDPFGALLIGLSLILYALQLAQVQWWLQTYDSMTITFYVMLIMTLVVAGWWGTQGAPWQTPTIYEIIAFVILATVGTYLARLTLFASVARIGSGQNALLWPLQTLTTIIIAVIFLNEHLSPIQWFGAILVLGATFLALPGIRLRRLRFRQTT